MKILNSKIYSKFEFFLERCFSLFINIPLKYMSVICTLYCGTPKKTDKNVKGQKLHSRQTTGQCEKTD